MIEYVTTLAWISIIICFILCYDFYKERKFWKERSDYWYKEAVHRREIIEELLDKPVEGDEWKYD